MALSLLMKTIRPIHSFSFRKGTCGLDEPRWGHLPQRIAASRYRKFLRMALAQRCPDYSQGYPPSGIVCWAIPPLACRKVTDNPSTIALGIDAIISDRATETDASVRPLIMTRAPSRTSAVAMAKPILLWNLKWARVYPLISNPLRISSGHCSVTERQFKAPDATALFAIN